MTSHSATDTRAVLLRTALRRVRWSAKLGLAVVFVGLLVVVVGGLSLRYPEIRREAQRDAERLVAILSEHLAIQIDSVEETLLELASYSRFIGGPNASGQEWMTVLNVVSAGRSGIEALMVTDARGTITFSSLPFFMGESRADGNSFRALSENPRSDNLIADEPIRSSNDSRIIVPLGRVLRTPQAEFEGMVIANFAPEQLRDYYRAVDPGENGIVWLLKPPGFVLLREPRSAPNDEPWPSISLPGPGGEQTGTIIGALERGGQDYLTVYQTHGGTGLTVAVSLALRDVLEPWWTEVYVATAITLFTGLILLVAAIVVGRATRAGEATLAEIGGPTT